MSEEIEEKTRLKKIKESPLYKEITTAMNTIN
jgi:hypothetical protein